MKRGQKGFTIVETLLVLILLSIIGFTGYYVYHSRNNANSTYNNAAKTNSAAPTSTSSSGKFVFKELGVQFNLPNDLKGMSYSIQHFTDGDSAYLTIPSFKAVNEKCYGEKEDGAGPSFAAIGKVAGKFDQSQQIEAGLLKQFPDFYLNVSYPNGITGCTAPGVDEQYIFTEVHKLQDSFVKAFQATGTVVQ